MTDELTSFLFQLLRSPATHLRLIAQTPAVWPPLLGAAGLLTLAWLQDRRRAVPFRYATETYAAVFGIFTYAWFFQFGHFPWSEGDWREEWTFFSAWPQAMRQGELPFYLATARQGTERFFANPQTPLMPYVFLSAVVSVNTFVLLHAAIVYAIGVAGAGALRRDFSLGLLPWTLFLLVFSFNGHISAHLAAGHLPWIAYFLTPWVLWGAARIANRDHSTRTHIACAAALAGMILIGGWHVFVWSLLFLLFTCAWSIASLRSLVIVGTLTALLAAVRLAPAVSTFGTGSNIFISGFPGVASMLAALAGTPVRSDVLDPWELDAFIGYVGVAFLALGAVAYAVNRTRALALLVIPATALAILSYGNVYELTFFQLPGFVSQRVTTRFLVLPVLWLSFAGAVAVNQWWRSERDNRLASVLIVGGVGVLAMQLLLRVHTWRPHAETALPNPGVLKVQAVETPYLWAIWIGMAISSVTAAVLWRAWRRGGRD